MIRDDGSVKCDTCDEVTYTVGGSRGAVEAILRRRGWGAWPGLTVGGKPAPEHLCPACRDRGTVEVTPTRRRRSTGLLEGQDGLFAIQATSDGPGML